MLPVQFERRILLSLLYLLGLMALTSCAFKPNRFGIIFISNSGVVKAADIYRIPDNTQNNIEQLTFTPTIGEYQLLVSKNGDRVVFEAGPTGLMDEPSEYAVEELRHIYLLETASKKLKDMTEAFSVPPSLKPMVAADWSPDQRQFAVITYGTGLGIMDFDGKNKKDISIPSLGEIPNIDVIKWSPDGEKLALNREDVGITQKLQNPGSVLLIYDLENGAIRQLADYPTNCLLPKWSPTSHQVAVTCIHATAGMVQEPKTVRIFSTENPGQPYERLVLSPCQEPSWSPDGKQIAFVCDKGTNQMGLFTINADGNGIHEVKLENLKNPVFVGYPTWSPDGTKIVYVAGTDSEHENIYSINPDGSSNHPLTNRDASYQVISVYPIP